MFRCGLSLAVCLAAAAMMCGDVSGASARGMEHTSPKSLAVAFSPENQRDRMRLDDLCPNVSEEDISATIPLYISGDLNRFTNPWWDMLDYIQSDKLLNAIRENSIDDLLVLTKKVSLWLEVTNIACCNPHTYLTDDSYRLDVAPKLRACYARIRGDRSMFLTDIISCLEGAVVFIHVPTSNTSVTPFRWQRSGT